MGVNFGSFGKSRNAFGSAHRSVERLLLCDFLEHFVVGNVEKNGKSGKFEKSRNAFGTAHRPTPVFFIVVGYSEDFVKQTSRMIEKLSKSALRGCAWAKIKDERRE